MKFNLTLLDFTILMIVNTLIYFILKLIGVVSWSWFIVLSPLLFIIIALLGILIISVITYFTTRDDY
jgi:hypothetical protein